MINLLHHPAVLHFTIVFMKLMMGCGLQISELAN